MERRLTNIERRILDNLPNVLNCGLVNAHTFCLVWDAIVSITKKGKIGFPF